MSPTVDLESTGASQQAPPPYTPHGSSSNGADERTPLLSRTDSIDTVHLLPDSIDSVFHIPAPENDPRRKALKRLIRWRPSWLVLLMIATGIGSFVLGYLVNGNIHEAMRDKLWRDWQAEENHRAEIRRQWTVEEHEHATKQAQFAEEVVKWERQRVSWDEERLEWDKERAEWDKERVRWDDERRRWADEERAREEKERKRREEAERQRENMAWEDVTTGHCLRYGSREYTARLANVPKLFDPMLECGNRTLEIHGEDVLPERCALEGNCGDAVGHWTVDFDEPHCMPTWKHFDKKDCLRTGVRRWESVINDVEQENWMAVCMTTPAVIEDKTFPNPTRCQDYGWWSGKWGIWEVEDSSCT